MRSIVLAPEQVAQPEKLAMFPYLCQVRVRGDANVAVFKALPQLQSLHASGSCRPDIRPVYAHPTLRRVALMVDL